MCLKLGMNFEAIKAFNSIQRILPVTLCRPRMTKWMDYDGLWYRPELQHGSHKMSPRGYGSSPCGLEHDQTFRAFVGSWVLIHADVVMALFWCIIYNLYIYVILRIYYLYAMYRMHSYVVPNKTPVLLTAWLIYCSWMDTQVRQMGTS